MVNTDLWVVALQEIRLGAKKEKDKMKDCIIEARLRVEEMKVAQTQLEKLEFQHTEAKKQLQLARKDVVITHNNNNVNILETSAVLKERLSLLQAECKAYEQNQIQTAKNQYKKSLQNKSEGLVEITNKITALDIQLGHCRGVISSSTSSLNTLKSRLQQSEKEYQSISKQLSDLTSLYLEHYTENINNDEKLNFILLKNTYDTYVTNYISLENKYNSIVKSMEKLEINLKELSEAFGTNCSSNSHHVESNNNVDNSVSNCPTCGHPLDFNSILKRNKELKDEKMEIQSNIMIAKRNKDKYNDLYNRALRIRDITEQKNQISMKIDDMNNLLTINEKNLNETKLIESKLMTELKQLNIDKNQLDEKLRNELVNAERNVQETEEKKKLLMSAIEKCRADFDQV